MSGGRHIINKQIIEIHVSEKADVQQLQEQVCDLFYYKLLPIIEKQCDELSTQYGDCRIDQLNIDLGEVSIEELEEVFAQKLHEEVGIQEFNFEDQRGEQPAAGRPIEAIAYFIETGILPWWVEENAKKHLHDLFDQLLSVSDPQLVELVKLVGRNSDLTKRFINAFSEGQVQQAIQSVGSISIIEIAEARNQVISKTSKGEAEVMPVFWSEVLQEIALNTDLRTEDIVRRVMQALGEGDDVSADLGEENTLNRKQLVDLINNVLDQLKNRASGKGYNQVIIEKIRQLTSIHSHIEQWPKRQLIVLKSQLKALESDVEQGKVSVITDGLQQLEHLLNIGQNESPVLKKFHTSFNETDAIPITNSGLVILWPFIVRFFENLEYVVNKEFLTEEAQHKAALVLQYLVNSEATFFEGVLPLNKILCGITLSSVISPEPLTEEEKEMGEGLLKAVISNNNHWKNLTIDGLRRSYLQREGLLRTRDGHWLLQVKRETYDITLDKIPWSFNTIKLPWMNEILVVEWN
ncbi:hypothetical protein LVD15_15320 [Fulvivirga maritima]|uniref:contractile injection system tape measure protein n=1 Tax=Fulvivirga maritima TaxID=2904247 RepID=UPI001EED1834|nr:contractile injection system tape measure protein [Fulvivirga maritima]UII24684.1 hypothetical protein LVD15_15320 [Fulvivirga maritima]